MAWFNFRRSELLLLLLLSGCPKQELGGYEAPPPDGTEIRCPVTGERCTKTPETEAAVFEMRTFYFCTDEARVAFGKTPKKYAYR